MSKIVELSQNEINTIAGGRFKISDYIPENPMQYIPKDWGQLLGGFGGALIAGNTVRGFSQGRNFFTKAFFSLTSATLITTYVWLGGITGNVIQTLFESKK